VNFRVCNGEAPPGKCFGCVLRGTLITAMNTLVSGIVCRLCGRTIESDTRLTYVTCVLCRDSNASRVVTSPADSETLISIPA
jgi:hypothetical protein